MTKRKAWWAYPQQGVATPATQLVMLGPVISIHVEVMPELAEALRDAGRSVPPPFEGKALIDTGASVSAIDLRVVGELGLREIGTIPLRGIGHDETHDAPAYLCMLSVLGHPYIPIYTEPVAGVRLPAKTGDQVALVGRDFLRRLTMNYDGPGGRYELGVAHDLQ